MEDRRARRSADETRSAILGVALELFTRHGFEGTSIRDIADALGMTKSSLYYHFTNKEAIVRALLDDRRDEIQQLLGWIDEQPAGQDLVRRSALHWIDSTGVERLQGMRFAHANQPVMQKLATNGGDRGTWFDDVVNRLLPPTAPMVDRLRVRMAFDTISAALFAAQGSHAADDEVLAAARSATISLT